MIGMLIAVAMFSSALAFACGAVVSALMRQLDGCVDLSAGSAFCFACGWAVVLS